MRRYFIFLTMAAALLTGCGDKGKTAAELAREQFVADSAALKIAVTPTLDCLPLYVAAEHGMFEREGLNLQLHNYQAQMDQDTALMNGRVEGMTTDLVRAAWLKTKGHTLRYVAVTPLSWQLVSNPMARIRQLSQMDDKMVAMTRHSATAMLADRAVDSAGLQPERVFRIQVNDIGVRLNMMETGVMDAMLLPEPQATSARNMGCPVLIDSRRQDLQLGIIVFSEKAIADTARQRQVDDFVRIYNMACDTVNEQGIHRFADIIVRRCNVRPQTVDSLPADITFPHASPPRTADVETAAAWLAKH